MIGRNAERCIASSIIAPQTGGMPIDHTSVCTRYVEFAHHRCVLMQHAGPVHHLAQVAHAFIAEELGNVIHRDLRPGRFEGRGRNAGRRTKAKREWHGRTVVQHIAHTLDTTDVTDLMRITDRGNRAVHDSKAGELGRHQH